MATSVRSSLKLCLKLANAMFGISGLFLVVFGFWLLRVWQREVVDGSTSPYDVSWPVYTSICVGVGLCLMTCIGHTAADTSNAFCLSSYLVIMLVLILLETAFAADVYLNSDWEKDLPEDPTGMLNDIADYIESNSRTFRWVGLSIVSAQVVSVLLVIMLNNVGPRYVEPQLPLLHHHRGYPVQTPSLFFGADPSSATMEKAWKIQFHRREASEYD